jgi:hypothetical protein
MAGFSPNSTNITRTKRAVQQFSHLVVHPEYEYWRPEWSKIRDALAGQREIKRKGETYLRRMRRLGRRAVRRVPVPGGVLQHGAGRPRPAWSGRFSAARR